MKEILDDQQAWFDRHDGHEVFEELFGERAVLVCHDCEEDALYFL